jgi:hypothetical protein
VVIDDLAADRRMADWNGAVWGHLFGGCIQDVEDAFAGGAGGLEHLVEAVQAADGFIEKGKVEQECNEFAEGKDAVEDLGPPRQSTRTVPRAAAKFMAG